MKNLSIVMYHYVREIKKSKYVKIKGLEFDLFKEQIQFLKKNYTIISVEEAIDCYQSNLQLPEHAVVLTFDDGYVDHFEYVYEYLRKEKLKGAFYIPSKVIEDQEILDVNKIHFLLASIEDEGKIVKEIFSLMDGYREQYSLEDNQTFFKKECLIGYHKDTDEARFIKQSLQVSLPVELRKMFIALLFIKYVDISEKEFSKQLYLSHNQISQMIGDGMHIGSHGHNHYWLNKLSLDDQRIELEKSKNFLERFNVNKDYLSICYPYGGYNDDTLKLAEELGFKFGVTTKSGVANFENEKLLELSRLDTNEIPKDRNSEVNKWYH